MVLGKLETTAYWLLCQVAIANEAGKRPVKLNVAGAVPSPIRATWCGIIDLPIRRGLVFGADGSPLGGYADSGTAAGLNEVAGLPP